MRVSHHWDTGGHISETKWQDYLLNIWQFTTAKILGNEGSKIFQIINKPSEIDIDLKNGHSWESFPNLVTLSHTYRSNITHGKIC